MTIVPVSFADILGAPNARSLFEEYAAECSIPEIGPINPQAPIYASIEESGIGQFFGAYKDDELIGFACILATMNPHYGRKLAVVESLFAAKAHRKSGAGLELLAAIENYAREKECAGVLYSAPAGGALELLLERQEQYTHTNTVFFRGLP